ncbi:MAG: hypothetical protein ACOYLR_10345 [Chlorobium sp.]
MLQFSPASSLPPLQNAPVALLCQYQGYRILETRTFVSFSKSGGLLSGTIER